MTLYLYSLTLYTEGVADTRDRVNLEVAKAKRVGPRSEKTAREIEKFGEPVTVEVSRDWVADNSAILKLHSDCRLVIRRRPNQF